MLSQKNLNILITENDFFKLIFCNELGVPGYDTLYLCLFPNKFIAII